MQKRYQVCISVLQSVVRKCFSYLLSCTFICIFICPGNESTIELWTDLWNEITPGTEAGILQNLQPITDILRTALESASWTTKVQAANAVYTVALKSGHNIDIEARNTLLKILTDGLRGRTWDGKERLLNALAMLACNSKYVRRTFIFSFPACLYMQELINNEHNM